MNRTIDTALSFLQGLYPIGTGQLISDNLKPQLSYPDFNKFDIKLLNDEKIYYNKTHYYAIGPGISLVTVHNLEKIDDLDLLFFDFDSCPKAKDWLMQTSNAEELNQTF